MADQSFLDLKLEIEASLLAAVGRVRGRLYVGADELLEGEHQVALQRGDEGALRVGAGEWELYIKVAYVVPSIVYTSGLFCALEISGTT